MDKILLSGILVAASAVGCGTDKVCTTATQVEKGTKCERTSVVCRGAGTTYWTAYYKDGRVEHSEINIHGDKLIVFKDSKGKVTTKLFKKAVNLHTEELSAEFDAYLKGL